MSTLSFRNCGTHSQKKFRISTSQRNENFQILKKWPNIRMNAFVNPYVQIMRRKAWRNKTSRNKISGKGTSSLRKELDERLT